MAKSEIDEVMKLPIPVIKLSEVQDPETSCFDKDGNLKEVVLAMANLMNATGVLSLDELGLQVFRFRVQIFMFIQVATFMKDGHGWYPSEHDLEKLKGMRVEGKAKTPEEFDAWLLHLIKTNASKVPLAPIYH